MLPVPSATASDALAALEAPTQARAIAAVDVFPSVELERAHLRARRLDDVAAHSYQAPCRAAAIQAEAARFPTAPPAGFRRLPTRTVRRQES